jgi:predicted phage tail component-like protein
MDNKYTIYLDGESSEEVGLLFPSPLKLSSPIPRVKRYTVPGRNGDVIISDGSFENRTATVQACLYEDRENYFVKSKIAKLNEWLFSSLDYRKLTTSDDPSHYIMARVSNGPEISAKSIKVASFTIKFDCKPQRFLTNESKHTINTSMSFASTTSFPSKPLLTITYAKSPSEGKFTLNGNTMTIDKTKLIAANAPTTIYYDTETGRTYSDDGNGIIKDYVGIISGSSNILVKPGSNVASIGNLNSVTIEARGWEL